MLRVAISYLRLAFLRVAFFMPPAFFFVARFFLAMCDTPVYASVSEDACDGPPVACDSSTHIGA